MANTLMPDQSGNVPGNPGNLGNPNTGPWPNQGTRPDQNPATRAADTSRAAGSIYGNPATDTSDLPEIGQIIHYYRDALQPGRVATDPGPDPDGQPLAAMVVHICDQPELPPIWRPRLKPGEKAPPEPEPLPEPPTRVNLAVFDASGAVYGRSEVLLNDKGNLPPLGERFCELPEHAEARVQAQEVERKKVEEAAAVEAKRVEAARLDAERIEANRLGAAGQRQPPIDRQPPVPPGYQPSPTVADKSLLQSQPQQQPSPVPDVRTF